MKPKLSLVIGILCISFSPIFVKLAVAPPVTSAFYRIFLAWVLLVPYCIVKGKLTIGRKELLISILGGIVFASDIAVWNISLVKISATVSTLVANLAPVWVGLLSFLLFRQRSGLLFWMGTLVAMSGMVVLVGYNNLVSLHFNIGLVYALLASLLYAIYIVITKNVLKSIATLTFMFYNMLSASLFLFCICIFQHFELLHFSAATWFYFIGLGLICQLTGWLTINHALRYLEATKVSIALLGQTVIAGFLAVLLLHEALQTKEIAGSAIVLAGIAITFLKPARLNKI